MTDTQAEILQLILEEIENNTRALLTFLDINDIGDKVERDQLMNKADSFMHEARPFLNK